MKTVQTVTGVISVDDLNYVLMHEHVQVGYTGWQFNPLAPQYARKEIISRAVAKFSELKEYGVNCIVDPCPIELGRDPELLAEVSVLSGIYIVCSTGFDFEARGNLFALRHLTKEEVLEIYLKEISEGIGDTGIRPGVIKAATGPNRISDYEQKCLTAAGQAAAKTGLPIITHTENGTCGMDQLRIFKNQGVNPKKCLIGHCCANHDLAYHASIIREGGIVGFDRLGAERITEDRLRIATLCGLLQMGYSEHIVLSCDYVATYLGRDFPSDENMKNWVPSYIFKGVIPALKERGVTDLAIDNMLMRNPRSIFSL